MRKLIAINDQLVVTEFKEEAKTKSGIFLSPSQSDELTRTGVVKSIGSKITEDITVGDTVVWRKHSGETIKLDNEVFVCLRYQEVMAVVKSESFEG